VERKIFCTVVTFIPTDCSVDKNEVMLTKAVDLIDIKQKQNEDRIPTVANLQ
jgi:hypothetical protein